MKKILYSLMALGLFMTSCTDFDDPVVESYAAGPDVTITLDGTGDDFIKFTVTPGEGTAFYSVLVDESATAAAVDSVALYKAQYSGTVSVDAEKHPTYTYTIEATPNTTYQIYAVAGSDKGIVGSVAVKAVTTSDSEAPQLADYQYDAENKAMLLLFSEPVTRGEGAITVQVYKSKDIMNPVTLAAEEVQVLQLDATTVAILAPTTAPGAYLAFSYAERAFVDALDNGCEAISSGLNMQTGSFVGLAGRNTVVPFAITEANITAPAVGSVVEDWTQFIAEITLDQDLYVTSSTADNAITVKYESGRSVKTIVLSKDQWGVEANTVIFMLPEEPSAGANISFSIAEGAVTDAYGNGNEAFESSAECWTMFDFTATEEMVLRTFQGVGISVYDGSEVDLGKITLHRAANYDEYMPDGKPAVVITDLLLKGSEVLGYYDLDNAKVYIGAYYGVGEVTLSSGTYGSITYSLAGNDWIECTINSDGTLTTTDLGWVATTTDYQSAVGWLDQFSLSTFTPVADATTESVKANSLRKVNAKVAKNLKSLKK